jgi:hypothetical protein
MTNRLLPCLGVGITLCMVGPLAITHTRLRLPTQTKAPSVVGRVADTRTEPLAGVVVSSMPEAGGLVRAVTTGGDGTFRFDGLADGLYRVDFDLESFDLIRRNRVPVRASTSVQLDVVLPLVTLCECVEVPRTGPDPRGLDLRERAGLVVNQSGQPLPHARIELASLAKREVAYADAEGRFRVLLPSGQTWPLTASDSGFGAVTQAVSSAESSTLVFRLPASDTSSLLREERLRRDCRCAGDLFRHRGR